MTLAPMRRPAYSAADQLTLKQRLDQAEFHLGTEPDGTGIKIFLLPPHISESDVRVDMVRLLHSDKVSDMRLSTAWIPSQNGHCVVCAARVRVDCCAAESR